MSRRILIQGSEESEILKSEGFAERLVGRTSGRKIRSREEFHLPRKSDAFSTNKGG